MLIMNINEILQTADKMRKQIDSLNKECSSQINELDKQLSDLQLNLNRYSKKFINDSTERIEKEKLDIINNFTKKIDDINKSIDEWVEKQTAEIKTRLIKSTAAKFGIDPSKITDEIENIISKLI